MTEQAKILRVFKLISMLRARSRSITGIARELETTTRTVYRYIHLLEELGFIIDKDWRNQYFIHTTPEEEEKNLYFDANESTLLHNLISSGLPKHPLKGTILKKLFIHSEIKELPDQMLKARLGLLVQKLALCIKHSSQAVLGQYHSAHGDDIRDRLVEPFDLSKDYSTVHAFDLEDKMNKQFKIERIGTVVELDSDWKFTNQHEKHSTDIFGMSGDDLNEVELELSLRAFLLMREEYPRSASYLSQEEGYRFQGYVVGLEGIGRFVLGLLDEIKIHKPTALKDYIKVTIQKSNFTDPD